MGGFSLFWIDLWFLFFLKKKSVLDVLIFFVIFTFFLPSLYLCRLPLLSSFPHPHKLSIFSFLFLLDLVFFLASYRSIDRSHTSAPSKKRKHLS